MKERVEFQQLKKMGKNDLLRLLQECDDENRILKEENEQRGKTIEELRKTITRLEEEQKQKELANAEPGTLAEAMIQVNGVMEAAQKAAQQYIDRIQEIERAKQREAEAAIETARDRADRVLARAKSGAQKIREASANVLQNLQVEIDHMLAGARREYEYRLTAEEQKAACGQEEAARWQDPISPEPEKVPYLDDIIGANVGEDQKNTTDEAPEKKSAPDAERAGIGTSLGEGEEPPDPEAFLKEVDRFTTELSNEIKSVMGDIGRMQQSEE